VSKYSIKEMANYTLDMNTYSVPGVVYDIRHGTIFLAKTV